MRLVSWNINSLRLRLPLLAQVVTYYQPDIICLQETKARESDVPWGEVAALGYPFYHYRGEKGYNGVAILSRLPLTAKGTEDWAGQQDARHIYASGAGLVVHNFYVPAGGYEADVRVNPKFQHKLDFLRAMTAYLSPLATQPLLLVGDLNVAPLPTDVWSHEKMQRVVSHTAEEITPLQAARLAGNLVDVGREFIATDQQHFTWWSYRDPQWQVNNRGRRLDHIWLNDKLRPALRDYQTLPAARRWSQPSDHIPLMVELAI